ncbi:MAG: transglutaminase-like domain-containing protein, partial [Methanobacterium sp.]|nr:transglutaminase-like domain-containing protein [Methanobacterium sp.]
RTNSRLPNYVTVDTSITNTNIPSDLNQYLQSTTNCQVTDSRIKALAASITSGLSSSYDKAVAIFNWVRDNINYSFYYNTKYGAANTLKYRQGNCVDHSHLIVALARNAGLKARYVHATAKFTSGNTYGHAWAQILVNGKWIDADATSSQNSFGVIRNWSNAVIHGIYDVLPF